jgi:hypothetical protein
MRSSSSSPHRTASRLARLVAPLVAISIALPLVPQTQLRATTQQTTPLQDDAPYTLHVYADLVQIPTLVLDADLHPLPLISIDQFNISLDSGQRFHPTQMRLEGDDPINLSIFLDLGGDGYDLQPSLTKYIAAFTSQSLQPHDHVSIYAIDCTFRRTADNIPAGNADQIARVLDALLDSPDLHGSATKGPGCPGTVHLWNALGAIAKSMEHAPGRRVIIAITTGKDHKSSIKWNQLKRYAGSRSITIFGLSPLPRDGTKFHLALDTENPFNQLCQFTGGIVTVTAPLLLATDLNYVLNLVRGRYILEFPRPDNGAAGAHSIYVTLATTDAFIRPAGISYPLPDPAALSDPSTIPSPPSPAVYGKRRNFANPN